MPDAKAEIAVLVSAKDEASRQLKGITGQIQNMSKQFKIAGGIMMGAGAGITAALGSAMKAAAEEEAGIVRLSTAMHNMGIEYDQVKDSLEGWIDAQQQKTAIADDEQRESLAQLITMTDNLAEAQDLLTVAMDMSAARGEDLSSATSKLGYALSGNWGMVERMIPALKAAQTEEEKWMMLRQMFAGQAEAYGQTMAGQMKLMQHNLSDLKESIGAVVSEAVAPAIGRLSDFIRNLKETNPELLRMGTMGAMAGAGLLTVGGGLLLALGFLPQAIDGIKRLNIMLTTTRTVAFGVQTSIRSMAAAMFALGYIAIYIASAIRVQALPSFEDMGDTIKEAINPLMAWVDGLFEGEERLKEYTDAVLPAIDAIDKMKKALAISEETIEGVVYQTILYSEAEIEAASASGLLVTRLDSVTDAIKAQGDEQERLNYEMERGLALAMAYSNAPSKEQAQDFAKYYIAHMGEVELARYPFVSQSALDAIAGMLSFEHGGVVPGPIGQPVPIMAHGGEMFLGASRGGSRAPIQNIIQIYIDGREVSESVIDHLTEKVKLQGGL